MARGTEKEAPEFFKVYLPDFSHEHLETKYLEVSSSVWLPRKPQPLRDETSRKESYSLLIPPGPRRRLDSEDIVSYLHIPPAFVKILGGKLPNTVILRDIRGKCCHVELEEVEKHVFIKNGWQEFVRDHSVTEGDFLVFRYDGNVLFDVNIFGKSGCRRDESPDIDKTIIHVKKEETEEEDIPPHEFKIMQPEVGKDVTENSVSRGKSQGVAATKSAERKRHRAASFVNAKNPHFIALIGRSSKYNLYIPQHVLRKNNFKLADEIVLRDQNQKKWHMRLNTRKDGRLALVKGWSSFWTAHKLEVQDQCVFEFIVGQGRISKKIHVQVIHATKNGAKNPHGS